MKKHQVALAVVAMTGLFTVGCSSLQIVSDPDTFTPRQEEWYAAVRANYPGWRPDSLVQVQSAPLRPVISYPKPTPQIAPPAPETPELVSPLEPEPLPRPGEAEKPKPTGEGSLKPAVVEPVVKPAEEANLVPLSTYEVKNGDTLTGISLVTYGTAKYWKKIQDANPSLKDPKRLRYGMKITLPALPNHRAATKPAAEPEAADLPAVPAEPTDTAPETEPAPAAVPAPVPVATPAAVPVPVATPATAPVPVATPAMAVPAAAVAPVVGKPAAPAATAVPAAKPAEPTKTVIPPPALAPAGKSN
jgi:LysM repeat protein